MRRLPGRTPGNQSPSTRLDVSLMTSVHDTRGISGHPASWWHVLRHHRTRIDDGTCPDPHAFQNGGVIPDTDVILDTDGARFDGRTRMTIAQRRDGDGVHETRSGLHWMEIRVDQADAGRDEHVRADRDSG